MAIVERERTTLNPPKAAPTGWPIPLANAGIGVPPVVAGDVIRLVSMILMIVLNRFLFFTCHLRSSISLRKNASISVNFLIDMFLVLVVL